MLSRLVARLADGLDTYQHWTLAGVVTPLFYYAFGATGNQPVLIVLQLILIDCVTGVIRTLSQGKRLSSCFAIKGFAKKLAMVSAIWFCHVMDVHLNTGNAIKTAMAYYLSSVETISILENLAGAGVSLPPGLKKALLALVDAKGASAAERLHARSGKPDAER